MEAEIGNGCVIGKWVSWEIWAVNCLKKEYKLEEIAATFRELRKGISYLYTQIDDDDDEEEDKQSHGA